MGAQGAIVARSARFSPPASARTDLALPKFKLDLGVEAPSGIRIKNDLFDGEMKGKIKVVNTLDAPRLLGDAEMITGKMVFKDRTFQISSANVSFDNPAVINPRFTLTAATEVSGARIQLFANGNLESYRIELSSTPAMPESEIISLLAVGFTSDDLTRIRTNDRNVMQQGEAASLVLHSTDFNRDLQSKTGLQVQIDEAINTQVGTSIFRPRSDADPVSAPKIAIKRQIGERVDVSVGSTVGVGTNSQRQVNAEFRVTPGFSVMGVWDTLESSDAQTQNSYGIDLKVQKRFK